MRESQAFGSLPGMAGLDWVKNSTEVTIDKHDKKALSMGPLILCVPQSGEGCSDACVEGYMKEISDHAASA